MPEQTAWFVTGSDGGIYWWSCAATREQSIQIFLLEHGPLGERTCREYRLVPVAEGLTIQ